MEMTKIEFALMLLLNVAGLHILGTCDRIWEHKVMSCNLCVVA